MQQFYEVSAADFDAFVERFEHWRTRLALTGWTCTQLRHADTGPDGTPMETSNAMVSILLSNMCYVLTCNRQWAMPVNPQNIDYVAFHEAMHLVLAELWDIAYDHCPPAMNDYVRQVEHAAIARLNQCFAPLSVRIERSGNGGVDAVSGLRMAAIGQTPGSD